MNIGERIIDLRKEFGLTLQQVSRGANVSLSQLSDIEHGRSKPSLETAEKIANFYGLNLSAFLQSVVVRDDRPDAAAAE